MSRRHLFDTLLLPLAALAVMLEDRVWHPVCALLDWVQRLGPLQRLHQRVARLPPTLALPLFLVPEAVSRGGWVASAWLLMTGAAGEALLVYTLTKLLAGLTALWIYRASEPALLRVRWFARLHGAGLRLRRAVLPANSRFAALRHQVRREHLAR